MVFFRQGSWVIFTRGIKASSNNRQRGLFEFLKNRIIVEIAYVDEHRKALDSKQTIFNGDTIARLPHKKATHLYVDQYSSNEITVVSENFPDSTFEIHTMEEFFIAKTISLVRKQVTRSPRGRIELYPIAINDRQDDIYIGNQRSLRKLNDTMDWRKEIGVDITKEHLINTTVDELRVLFGPHGYDVVIYPRIEMINFDLNMATIRTLEYEKLALLASILNRYHQTNTVIGAQTDTSGSAAYNQSLSRRLAAATRGFLIKLGIAKRRMKTVAYGESLVLMECSNCTKYQHAVNRRVQFDVGSAEY